MFINKKESNNHSLKSLITAYSIFIYPTSLCLFLLEALAVFIVRLFFYDRPRALFLLYSWYPSNECICCMVLIAIHHSAAHSRSAWPSVLNLLRPQKPTNFNCIQGLFTMKVVGRKFDELKDYWSAFLFVWLLRKCADVDWEARV